MEPGDTGKRVRASGVAFAVDRLSDLPDCLIHHIMSFMKARQAVQTCVLSTRWTHLWRSVPSLDVDMKEFRTVAARNATDDERAWEKFEDFTGNLMLRFDIATLESFRLRVGSPWVPSRGHSRSRTWIRRAMRSRRPGPGIQRVGVSSRSWPLKRLVLCYVHLDDGFANHVSSECHSLEELELKSCRCEIREVTSNSLKNLTLKNCKWSGLSAITSPTLKRFVIDEGKNAYNCLLTVTAPAVTYVHLVLSVLRFPGGVLLNEMPSLAEASIFLRNLEFVTSFWKSNASGQLKLLESVSNVTSLELLHFGTMLLSEESTSFPEFRNLETLTLTDCDLRDNFQTLFQFLKKSPNLEQLTLKHCKLPKTLKKKGTKKAWSIGCLNTVGTQCKNLKCAEIIYRVEDAWKLLVLALLMSVPGNLICATISEESSHLGFSEFYMHMCASHAISRSMYCCLPEVG